jgi:peptidoglycan hydrolase-like protein with peptidoglycan-binding domain
VPWVHRTARSAVAVLAAVLVVGALGTGTAEAAAVPDPAPRADLGVAEGFTPYLPQVSCDPVAKPGTLALRSLLMATYGGRDLGITRGCEIGALSEHKEGRAWDWGLSAAVPAEKALAQQFLGWLTAPGPNGMAAANARRLGVMYVIWNGKIWSAYRASEGWRSYSGGEAHAGHIHISLAWNGAMERTSWWTGSTGRVDYGPCVAVEGDPAPIWTNPNPTPCPTPISAMTLTGTPLLAQESSGAYVLQLQRLLKVSPVTGFFGPITASAVTKLQTARGLPVTGTTTPATWAAARNPLAPPTTVTPPAPTTQPVTAARSLPASFGYTVRAGDSLSAIAAKWGSTVAAIKSASQLRSDVIRVGQVITVPVRSGITKFTYTTLRKGSKGVAVTALQSALRMRPKYRTGVFGDITKARVSALKKSRGWRADGIAGPAVWRALGA